MFRFIVHILPGLLIAIAATLFSTWDYPNPYARLIHLGVYLFGVLVFAASLYLETLEWSSWLEIDGLEQLRKRPRAVRLVVFVPQIFFLVGAEVGNFLVAISWHDRDGTMYVFYFFLALHFIAEFLVSQKKAPA